MKRYAWLPLYVLALWLFLPIVVSCQPAPDPTPERPQPTAELPDDPYPGPEPRPEFVWGGGYGIIFPILWNTTERHPPTKHGLAWHTTVCGDAEALGVSWYFNWESRRNSCPGQPPPVWYPMWRPHQAQLWEQRIADDYDGLAIWLNEPDRADQDNLTPVEAAFLYRDWQTHICPRCKTVALNLSKANPGYLVEWRESYRAMYQEYPAVYAYGMHSYGLEHEIIGQLESFRGMLLQIGEGDKPVFISEWGGCWQGEQPYGRQLTPEEMTRVISQFEAWDWVKGYAFFGVRWYKPGDPPPPGLRCDSLFNDEGITPLGQSYNSPPQGYP